MEIKITAADNKILAHHHANVKNWLQSVVTLEAQRISQMLQKQAFDIAMNDDSMENMPANKKDLLAIIFDAPDYQDAKARSAKPPPEQPPEQGPK